MKTLARVKLGFKTIISPNYHQHVIENTIRELVGDVGVKQATQEKTISVDPWDPTKFRDPRATKLGLSVYRQMDDTPAVASSHALLKSFAMSGFTIEPGQSDDMERSRQIADFFKALFRSMDGSEIGVLRDQMLDEALKMGFCVAEDVWEPMVIPGFGRAMGLKALKVRPAETFWSGRSGEGGIITDKHGNVTMLQQESGTDYIDIDPADVFLYSFHGTPANPYGRSTRYAAYPDWMARKRLVRNYDTYCLSTASGIKELEMDDEDWENDALVELTRQRLEKLAPQAIVIHPEGWSLKLHMPPGTAGQHFLTGIAAKDSGIRVAILTVDSLSSGTGTTDSYASLDKREEIAHDTMEDAGVAFLQAFNDYIVPKAMIKNGFNPDTDPWPVFLPKRNKVPPRYSTIMSELGDAKQKGVVTYNFKEEDQLALVNGVLSEVGMKVEGFEQVEVNIPEFNPPPDSTNPTPPEPDGDPEPKKDLTIRPSIILAGSPRPKGRTIADVKKDGKAYDLSIEKATKMVTEIAKDVTTRQIKAIESALFTTTTTGKQEWKTSRSREIRKAMEDNIGVGKSDMHKVLISMSQQGWNLGQDQASAMVGGMEKIQLSLSEHHQLGGGLLTGRPKPMTRATADDWIWNNTYEQLKKTFASLENGAWHILDNANRNVFSPAETSARLRAYFIDKGWADLAATRTIINTTYATVYNMARTNLWDSLADPSGTIPGGVTGYFIDAIMDDHTSDFCIDINDKFFRIDDPSFSPPPYHPNCRTVSIPVMSGEEPWGGSSWLTLEESAKYKANMKVGFGG